MKPQSVILLVIAVACGLVTMFGVRQYMSNKPPEAPKVRVLVAAESIKSGRPLSESVVEFREVAKEDCPKGAVTTLEQIEERSLKISRDAGDWILEGQLTEKGDRGVTPNIPPGMRVVTIPVNATTSHSGLMEPGNRVDLLFTFRTHDANRNLVEQTITLMEYIEVFAVEDKVYGRDAIGENSKASNISLLVTVEQAAKLTHASKKGIIATSLRSAEDIEESRVAAVTDDIFSSGKDQINDVSSADVREQAAMEDPGFVLPEPGPEEGNGVVGGLLTEMASSVLSSGPLDADSKDKSDLDDFWVMAIHERGAVRVARVNLKSDEPIDTTGSLGAGAPAAIPQTGPAGAMPQLPGLPGLPGGLEGVPGGLKGLDQSGGGLEGLQEGLRGGGLEGLEDAALEGFDPIGMGF